MLCLALKTGLNDTNEQFSNITCASQLSKHAANINTSKAKCYLASISYLMLCSYFWNCFSANEIRSSAHCTALHSR